jgi:hypothetical protein
MLGKKDFKKMFDCIDPSQLLENYGGNLKLRDKIWPPHSTTDGAEEELQPTNKPETPKNHYQYDPHVNPGWETSVSEAVSPENYRETVIEEKVSPLGLRMGNIRHNERQATEIKLLFKPNSHMETEAHEADRDTAHKPKHANQQVTNSAITVRSPRWHLTPVTSPGGAQVFDVQAQTELVTVIGQEPTLQTSSHVGHKHVKRKQKACCHLI